MRKLLVIFIIAALLTLTACKGDEPQVVPADVSSSPVPQETPGSGSPLSTETEAPSYGKNAAASITDTAALFFEGTEGLTLYGAIAFENTGDCPIIIGSAAFTFSVEGGTIEHSFTPAFAEYTVLLPGETSFLSAWLLQEEDSGFTAETEVTLSASINAVRAASDMRILLSLDNLFLADNYPAFTTLSGRMTADAACGMNVIHTGFYDESGDFLGAWYFTKNTLFESGEAKDFVVQMRGFPIDALSEKAAEIEAMGFGFTL
ncbi:MAG: hypothetical protein E7330_00225 [Clostridiales bacterium]|nr:hypothetical protein [Clostridiales bacterium]